MDAVALRKVGSSRVVLDKMCYNKECNLGNFITDAMVNAVRTSCFAIVRTLDQHRQTQLRLKMI